ncbi:MAG: glycosyltransferase family 4 protein [Chitinophagaceae bacterium]|nr:glycosyltransferase family 4 protein [Chitinophagaceae bacterium]
MTEPNRRIAIIDHVGSKAGMDYYTYMLASGLTQASCTVAVFSNFRKDDSSIRFFPYFITHTRSNLKKAWNHFSAFLKTALSCRRQGYKLAIVHLFSYTLKDLYALLILHIFGIKIIAIVHDVQSFAGNDHPLSQQIIFKYLTDRLMVHNRFSYRVAADSFGKTVTAKMKIIPHGNFHSLAKARPEQKAAARALLHLDPAITYLLFFGQIKDVKGLDIRIKAMPHLPGNVHLLIAGKPWKNDFRFYENLIDQSDAGARIHKQIGFIEDEQRDLLFKACDLLILPYKEIFQSGVQLMAMSYKIPIVASNLEPMRELIRHGESGFLFETENELSLAASVREALSRPDLLPSVAETAWERTKNTNDWKEIANQIINW